MWRGPAPSAARLPRGAARPPPTVARVGCGQRPRRELGEAEGAVGGGVGQPLSPGSGRRGSAGLLPRPAGGRERPRPASLPGQPLICERRRCLGPPGSGAGCGARGWREQGGGCRCRAGAQACGGRQCPSGGGVSRVITAASPRALRALASPLSSPAASPAPRTPRKKGN